MLTVFIYPMHAKAIIILPAIILIPIAQMLATVIASLSIPIAGLGLLIKTMTKNHRLAIAISLFTLFLILVVATLVLRYQYPDNPWI